MKSQQQFLGAIKRQGIKKKLKTILQIQNSGLQQLQILLAAYLRLAIVRTLVPAGNKV